MSNQTVIQLFDDLDGSPIPDGGGTTILISLEGASYEIDLTTRNAERLRAARAEYIQAGRKTAASSALRSASRPAPGGTNVSAMRE